MDILIEHITWLYMLIIWTIMCLKAFRANGDQRRLFNLFITLRLILRMLKAEIEWPRLANTKMPLTWPRSVSLHPNHFIGICININTGWHPISTLRPNVRPLSTLENPYRPEKNKRKSMERIFTGGGHLCRWTMAVNCQPNGFNDIRTFYSLIGLVNVCVPLPRLYVQAMAIHRSRIKATRCFSSFLIIVFWDKYFKVNVS